MICSFFWSSSGIEKWVSLRVRLRQHLYTTEAGTSCLHGRLPPIPEKNIQRASSVNIVPYASISVRSHSISLSEQHGLLRDWTTARETIERYQKKQLPRTEMASFKWETSCMQHRHGIGTGENVPRSGKEQSSLDSLWNGIWEMKFSIVNVQCGSPPFCGLCWQEALRLSVGSLRKVVQPRPAVEHRSSDIYAYILSCMRGTLFATGATNWPSILLYKKSLNTKQYAECEQSRTSETTCWCRPCLLNQNTIYLPEDDMRMSVGTFEE